MHLAPSAAFGEAFEVGAARIHDRNDRRREGLAENQSSRHGERRDDVEPDLATPDAAQDLDDERGERGCDTGKPDEICHIAPSSEPERKTYDES
ncbi:hypothetical protein KU6B_59320 (plasmid) [Mameliella alba]|nr:hypothetical protein KU6B_59320 [Mameliella alba]